MDIRQLFTRHVTAGIAFVTLILAGPVVALGDPPPTMLKIWPTYSYTCGARPCRVFAMNYQWAAVVKLVKQGEPDILGTNVFVVFNRGSVDVVFELDQGTAAGLWSVVLTNPDNQSHMLVDAFEVIPGCPRGRAGDLYVANQHGRNGPHCDACPNDGKGNVLQFDGVTGEFICVFASGGGQSEADQLWLPFDLTWGPNGNLFVCDADGGNGGKVIEYDGRTGDYVRTFVPRGGVLFSPTSLDFGGPNGNLYVLNFERSVLEFDRATGDFIREVFDPRDISRGKPQRARFGPNGNLFVTYSGALFDPTFAEFDPVTGAFIRALLRETGVSRHDFTFEQGLGAFLVTDDSTGSDREAVIRVDFEAGGILETVIRYPPGVDDPFLGPGGLSWARDLAYGPSGNLFVGGQETRSLFEAGNFINGNGAMHEYDGQTYDPLLVFGYGHSVAGPIEGQLYSGPSSAVFKLLPGDFGGEMQGGDWRVDLNDFEHFTDSFTGPDVESNEVLALIAFDADHDGDIDWGDFAGFQQAFGSGLAAKGACCHSDGSCTEEWKPNCDGVYQGDDITCDQTECPGAGACCLTDGTCRELTANACSILYGDFQGEGVTCVEADCPPPACPKGVPGVPEGELWCQNPDIFNGGCNSNPPVFSPITCGDTICGTAWAEDNVRDTDWYELIVTEDTLIDWTVTADFDVLIGIVVTVPPGSGDCADTNGLLNPFDRAPAGAEARVLAILDPGIYWFFVAPDAFSGYECATGPYEYTATLTCGPPNLPATPPLETTWQTAPLTGPTTSERP